MIVSCAKLLSALVIGFILLCGMLEPLTVSAETVRFEEGQRRATSEYVYDPLVGESVANAGLFDARQSRFVLPQALESSSSFTLEAFTKPAEEVSARPKQFLPVFQASAEGSELVLGIYRSKPPHSYHWWQSRLKIGGQTIELAKNKYRGISMVSQATPWRHVALTWDAKSREMAFYLDYRLMRRQTLPEGTAFSFPDVSVGADAEGTRFPGVIDEVRLTAQTLPPWEFLRASAVPLKDVSFAPDEDPSWPSDYGQVDVRLHYGAVGDGVHDDTAAIQRAFQENDNRVPIAYQTVYFPAGTYLISDTIQFRRFMVVRGAGKGRTRIRLKDSAEGYQDTAVPKPAFAVGYYWPYVNRPRKNRAGNVIGNYIFDLSIETGKGNPAALGLDFHCNNLGTVENVDIVSGDGSGLVGLDFQRGWPGPCLIKNVNIKGFDRRIVASHREYSLVFSGIELEGQREAAIVNNGNVLSIEKLTSRNSVPAIQNRGGGLVVLIDSELTGGDPEAVAVQSTNASVYLRDVAVEGYLTSLLDEQIAKSGETELSTEKDDRLINEYWTGPSDAAFENQAGNGSLKLPIRETPDVPRPPVEEWVNVLAYEHLVENGDWSPAIQAAIDAGAELIYFPDAAKYRIDRDVVLRGKVRTLLGGSPKSTIGTGDVSEEEVAAVFVLDASLPVMQFEMLSVGRVVHQSPTTLIFKHGKAEEMDAGPGCGPLFIEDAGGKWRFNEHQRVWGRQLNPETKGVPENINDGGQLWMLGMKTEYLSTKIVNRNGASTELLGGLMYPVHPVTDETLPMFINEESDISLIHGVSVYKKNHKIYMRDIQGVETREFLNWRWVSGRPLVNLYSSRRGE